MNNRRKLIVALGAGALATPFGSLAQQPDRTRRIGVLMGLPENDPEAQLRVTAFQKGLQQLGWTPGGNVRIDYRWGAADVDRRRALVAELVNSAPNVILAVGAPVLTALQQAARTIPIVFVQVEDPIGSGFVSSLARPGGNITGFTHFDYAMGGKWLEMLKEIAPNVMRVAILQTLGNPSWPGYLRAIEAAAPALRVQLVPVRVRDAAEIERAIDVFARESNGGMIMLPDITAASHRALVIALAARYRLPAIYSYRFFVTAGGLMSYAPNNIDQYPRAASYIDRILRGEKAGELPIQRPTKFELVINLKTAKALGLTIPKSLLISVDEMIE